MPKKLKSLIAVNQRTSSATVRLGSFDRKSPQKSLSPLLFPIKTSKSSSKIQGNKLKKGAALEKCSDLGDSEVVKVILTQNREAYRELFRRYEKKLFSYVYHMVKNKEETEDLLQDIFVKTYRNIDKFDVDRKFSSWIYRIAHNETVNFLKRRNKRHLVSWEEVTTTKDKLEMNFSEDFINDVWVHKEISEEIDESLKKLPEKYRRVLFLRYFSEYSYEKIALIIKKPINTVGTLINRAKRKLLDIVREDEKDRRKNIKHSSTKGG